MWEPFIDNTERAYKTKQQSLKNKRSRQLQSPSAKNFLP